MKKYYRYSCKDCQLAIINGLACHEHGCPTKKTFKRLHHAAMSEAEYLEYRDLDMGMCTHCGNINDDFHEPDATDYPCTNCEKNKSHGIEQCLIMGFIEIE